MDSRLKWFWPYAVRVIRIHDGPAEVERRMSEIIVPGSVWLPPDYTSLAGRYRGTFQGRKFKMAKMVAVKGMMPLIFGTIRPSGTGAEVELRFTIGFGYLMLAFPIAIAGVVLFRPEYRQTGFCLMIVPMLAIWGSIVAAFWAEVERTFDELEFELKMER